jgi:hypothetical protein
MSVCLQLLLFFSKDVSKIRARFIATLPRGGTSHTVLITDIPGVDYGTLNSMTNKVGGL